MADETSNLPALTNAVEQDDQGQDELDAAAKPASIELDKLAGEDGGDKSRRLARYWLDQIDKVDDEQKRWIKRGKAIEKRYRDERNRVDEDSQRRVNTFWANIQVLLPSLYGRCPVPIVERRFHDKDEVGRGASQIIERACRNEIEINDFHESVTSSVMDYLLPGRGITWVRYEPQFGPGLSVPVDSQNDLLDSEGEIEPEDDTEEEEKVEETGSQVIRESAPVDYISWLDLYLFPPKARKWKEVRAIGKRIYMSRGEMKERWGDEIGEAIPLQSEDREKRNQNEQRRVEDELDAMGEVFEIWDKDTLSVYWVARDYSFLCDRKDDFLKLENFWPCPRPLIANGTNNTLTPVPDYAQYQDQACMLDELTHRIAMLSKACKVAGVYNAAADEISRLLDESVENELIPVDKWAAFAEKGGLAGQIVYLPLKEIIGVLQELVAVKAQVRQELDLLSGIPDIMRGTSDARETMGAQRLKQNGSGTRLGYRQAEVARFARDTLKLVAEVMCKHFSPKSLIEASGALYEEGLGAADVKMLGFGDTADQPLQPPLMGGPPGAPALPPPGAGAPPPGPPGQPPQRPPGPPQMTAGAPGAPPGPPGAPPPALHPAGSPPGAGMPPGGGGPPRPPFMPSPPTAPGMPMGPPGPGGMPPLGAMGPQQDDPDAIRIMRALIRIAKSIDLLRDDHIRGFRVDIEVDSTIFADQEQEKADRTEFIGSITKFLQVAMAMAAQMPEVAPLLGKLLQFGVRGFKVGRDLEAAIEEFVDQAAIVAKQRAQQAQQQPNPDQIKAQVEQQRGALDMAKIQAEGQQLQVKTQADAAAQKAKAQSDAMAAQAEVRTQQLQSQAETTNSAADLQAKQMDMQMRMAELKIEELRLQGELAKLHAARMAPQGPQVSIQ